MADFNAQDYFARLAQDAANQEQITPVQDRYIAVKEASAKKKEQLDALAITQQKQQELDKASWVGKLDLDPNSITGETVNLGANLVDGAATVASNFMTSLHIGRAALADNRVPDEVKAAWQRQNGKPTIDPSTTQTIVPNPFAGESEQDKADKALLSLPAGDTRPDQIHSVNRQWEINEDRKNGTLKTNADQIALMNSALDDAKTVRNVMDVSSIVHRGNQRAFEEDLRDGFKPEAKKITDGWDKLNKGEKLSGVQDITSGLTGLFTNIGSAAINNKTAVVEFITNNIPQLGLAATGPAGLAVTNISYAVDEFGKGMQAYKDANGGALPNAAETREMAAWAASLAVAETVGDKLTLGASRAASKIPGGIAETARKTLKDALKATAPGRIAANAAEGAIGEFATEAYQTAVENKIEGKEVTAEDTYVGGAIGALVGGGLGASVRTAAEVTKSTPEQVEKRIKDQTDSEALQASIKSGDVSAYLDPKKPSYAPEKAVAALYGNAKEEGATPETKQANLEQATKVIADLEEKQTKLQDTYDSLVPEKNQAYLAQVKEELAKTDPADTEKVADLKDKEELLQGLIDDTPKADPKKLESLKTQLDTVTSQLNESRDTLTAFHQELQPKDLNVEDEVAAINAPVEPVNVDSNQAEDAQAVPFAPRANGTESVINLSMAVPERLSIKDANNLADNTSNALTEPQRSYLRAFSEARQAENALKDQGGVSAEIYTGSKKNIGIAQYRARTTAALAAGNESVAANQIQQLQKFEQDHQAKADVAEQALKQGIGTQIVRTDSGQWLIATEPLSRKQRAVNGGLTINSPSLVQSIRTEANALTAATKELQAAYALKFDNNTSTQGIENVQNSPQRQESKTVSSSNQEGEVRSSGSTVESQSSGAEVRDASTKANGTELNKTTQEANASTVDTQVNSVDTVDKTNQGQLQSTEGAKDTTAVEQDKPAVVLTPLADKTPEGTPHNEKRFGDFFTQNAGRDSDGSVRPLASVKDFLSQVKQGTTSITDYLKNKAELTGDQQRALNTFTSKAKEWASTIQQNLRIPHNTKFDYEKPMNYLVSVMEKNGVKAADVDENIKTAMTAAVFSFIADQSARDTINNKEAINAMLGRTSDTPVSDTAFELLAQAGQYQPMIADSLGGKIMDVLGIAAGQNTPKDIPAKLRAALGAHALKLMEDQGLLTRKDIPADVIEALRNEGKDPEKQTTTDFAEFKDHHFYKLSEQSKGISESMKGSQNVIQNLFGIESGSVLPSLTPYKKVQTKSDTGMLVPNLIKRVFKQKQTKDAWYVNKAPMDLLGHFTEEEALQLAGVTEVTPENTHVRNQLSRKAKNDGLIRQFKQFMDFVRNDILTSKDKLDQPMFMTPTMWKQQRAGLLNNVANPQTSKVVRPLIAPKEWDTEIKLNDSSLVQSFKLRVAEGLGKKTEQGTSDKSVAWIDATMQEPVYVEAIKAIQASFTDAELTADQKKAILTANAKGGENLHTFTALIAWAKYQDALAANKESFITNLMGEVDGVANGSSLNNMLYGAATSSAELNVKAERGGMYTDASSAQQYNQWYGGNNRDTYQANAVLANEAINNLAQQSDFHAAMIAAIWATSKVPVDEDGVVTKGGRNLLKTALNPLNYGSGFKAITRNMSAAYIDGIYAQFEEFSKANAPQESVDAFVNALNSMLKESGARPLPVGQSISRYMAIKLNDSQTLALETMYQSMIAAPVTDTIKETFAPLLEKTRQLVATTQLTYDIYNAVYEAERDAFIKELGIPFIKDPSNRNPKVTRMVPIHDLTPAQEKELQKRVETIVPMMNTAMSTNDGDITHGILLADRERAITNTAAYTQQVAFGTPLKNGATNMTIRGYSVQDASPRVMAISGTTQALDSQISHTAQDGRNILNAHDAIGAGIGILSDAAQALNKATWDSLLNYSPLTAAYEAMQRVINGLAEMEKAGTLSKEAKEALSKVFAEQSKRSKDKTKASIILAVEMNKVFQAAYQANSIKLGSMTKMTSFDQYAFDGGNYEVSKDDRDAAAKKLAELPQSMSETAREALYTVIDAVNGKSTAQVKEAPVGVPSPFGDLGTPTVKSDADLVKFFESNPDAKASDVIKLLAAPDRLNAINRKILQLLYKTVNPNLTIKYVTPQTLNTDVIGKATNQARGWYYAENSKEGFKDAIYVLSPEFKNSGLTAETLLHEMVHASLAKLVEDESRKAKKDPSYSSNALKLIEELENLAMEAATFMSRDRDLFTQFGPAVTSVHELIAWGMTNSEFQDKVLKQIQFKSKSGTNVLVVGMQKFISAITRLLFNKTDSAIDSGMSTLATNVSGLFYQAGIDKQHLNFWKWFGDSKVTSPDGSPLRVYHGTANSFDEFKKKDAHNSAFALPGFFFTPHTEVASFFAESAATEEEGSNVIPAYLRMVNPLVMDMAKEALEIKANDKIAYVREKLNKAQQGKYDGAIIKNWDDGSGDTQYVVFDANQIKSAIGNNGNYSSDSSIMLEHTNQAVNPIEQYNTMEVYEALGNGSVTPIFDTHLRNLLTGIVEKLHGPFGAIADAMRKTEAGNPVAVWLKALETGKAPFASSIVASGFAASSQEDFAMQQVEATVKAALDGGNTVTKLAYSELSKLYTEAYSKLKPSDFKSQADYDFVFKLESNGNRSDYLARFAAMGLGHQGFNSMLQMASDRETRKVSQAKSFGERLNIIFTKILEFFADKVNKTYAGQTMDSKLEALVNQLVDIEAKKRHALKMEANKTDYIAPIEDAVKKGGDIVRDKVLDIANSPKVRNATNGFVAGAGGLVRIVANNQVNMVLGFLKEQADGRKFVPKIIQELIGHDLKQQELLRGTKENERQRKSIIDNTAKFTLQTFLNEGKGLTKEDKASIASVVMRTGLHNLLGHYDLKEISDLIGDKTALNSAISAYEGNLNTAVSNKQIEAANVLGNYKATGSVRGFLMMNAHNIARMVGTPYAKQITEKEAVKAEENIKVLATLYALKYMDKGQLTLAKNVLDKENQRSDGNGIEFTMAMQKQLEAESLEKVFGSNPTLMVHGYTPEILNPHTSIKIANAQDGANLKAQGYSEGAEVISDHADPTKEAKRIYVLRDGGMAPWLSGAISLTGMGAKGAKKHNGYLNTNTVTGANNAGMNSSIMNDKVSLLSSNLDPRRDLSKVSDNHLAPVYNEEGNIVNWRYLMAERVKDTVMERTNDFEKIMGTFAGSTYDKVSSKEQNQKVIQALYDQFNKDFATKRDQYVLVGPNSPDADARELWNQQSNQTKNDARSVWGRDGMWVKKESLDMVFGYRKLSIASFLREEQDTLEGSQKILREWFNIFAKSQGYTGDDADNYAKKIGIALTKGERAWQEIVREAKDIIVVKTGVVMLGNIWSNESLLTLNGVPLKGRFNHHLTAMKGATSYQRDTAKLQELQAMIDTGYAKGNEKQIQRDIIRLKDAIDRNPVRVLVEEGLMPTIVEDIGADEDNYSYKTAFARKTEKYTNKLNPVIKNVAKQVYMTHDTKQYQTLARITQLSDFVARYTLYQHLISRKTDPLSHADAIQHASEAFVNYDIPMHRGLQYTDDMGITMFTKYFLRIQKPLMDLAKDHPARVLGTVALNRFMSLGPIVLESSWMHHLGWNPVRMGALEYPSAFGQLPAFDAIGGAFKLIE